jgi:DnaJ-class molecular chaperone
VAEAALGAKVDVPTLDGTATVTVPPGTSSGRKLRLRGKGVPPRRGEAPGDLYVDIQIVVPDTIDEASQYLIRKFAELNPTSPRDGLWK